MAQCPIINASLPSLDCRSGQFRMGVVASKKRPFTGLLLKAIDVDDARLRACALRLPCHRTEATGWLTLEPNFGTMGSVRRILWTELQRRRYLGSSGGQGASSPVNSRLAPMTRNCGASSCAWQSPTCPAFESLGNPAKRNIAHPANGMMNDWRELLADVEYLKRTRRMTVRQICQQLPRKKRLCEALGDFRPAALLRLFGRRRNAAVGCCSSSCFAVQPRQSLQPYRSH